MLTLSVNGPLGFVHTRRTAQPNGKRGHFFSFDVYGIYRNFVLAFATILCECAVDMVEDPFLGTTGQRTVH